MWEKPRQTFMELEDLLMLSAHPNKISCNCSPYFCHCLSINIHRRSLKSFERYYAVGVHFPTFRKIAVFSSSRSVSSLSWTVGIWPFAKSGTLYQSSRCHVPQNNTALNPQISHPFALQTFRSCCFGSDTNWLAFGNTVYCLGYCHKLFKPQNFVTCHGLVGGGGK